MNTNQLKRFAQAARLKLLDQIGAKLEKVLTTDSAELREKANQIQQLQEAINKSSKQQVIDTVAYTWFNRLVALRFMDVNGYEPIGIKVVSPASNATLPELLQEAKDGNIPQELPVNHQRIYQILDGSIPSANAQNEAYRELLVGACNHLHTVFPFLFERINDYSELLLPDDLISSFSIIEDIKQGMLPEDCQEVEILGWLYQFYISERKDELINAKKRYKADEIAPVTQLFTPKWIVQYMVDNTLGQFWKEARTNTTITNGLEFYIKPNNPELIPLRDLKSVEDITFFDPCVGSAHVLCYAFDIFYKMYEEEGYNPSDIPELIISKNLYGIDIDERAAQLAGFALMMKCRKHHRRFFKKQVVPNITAYQNIASHPKFENAKILGSLIKITQEEADSIKVDKNSLFAQEQIQLKKQATLLANKYDIVVTNPPYLNSSYMEGTLKKFVDKEYKQTKSDLFACFQVQVSNLTKENGLIGFICPYVWMFIKSYEWLREYTINNTTFASLIQLEYNAFGPAVVPIGTFVLRNNLIENYHGSYVKLSDFKGVENQKPRTLEAIQNPDCGWLYLKKQSIYNKIPGSLIGYWLSDKVISNFIAPKKAYCIEVKKGLSTGSVDRFMKFWHEIHFNKINFQGDNNSFKWFPYMKGGEFRRWSGNKEYVVNWENNGFEVINFKDEKGKQRSRPQNVRYYFNPGITYSALTNYKFSVRKMSNSIFGGGGDAIMCINPKNINYIIGFFNSSSAQKYLSVLSPTMNFEVSHILSVPVILDEDVILNVIEQLVIQSVLISDMDWNANETAWDFQKNELIRIKGQDLEEAYDSYCHYWQNKFMELHKNEEALNKQFIDIYGLQDELTPDVPLEDITILKEETSIVNNQLVFNTKEVLQQFVSYAVGCMFGRYSLDQPGLILANQGETLEDYLKAVTLSAVEVSFLPDDDNIIPILDNEWFEDDIVGRFYEFLKVTFGKPNFEKNLAFVEECLGKDIRKYFLKDFYNDHWKRYKKRPIYWMFSSPSGAFNVLIYMHRYTPDTLNQILNGYLKDYREKLTAELDRQAHIKNVGTAREQTLATKEEDRIHKVLLELQEYERELYKLATERISIDLDDGVLVNYNKFGKIIKEVKGLNDKKAKDKVRKFDWIDVTEIR